MERRVPDLPTKKLTVTTIKIQKRSMGRRCDSLFGGPCNRFCQNF